MAGGQDALMGDSIRGSMQTSVYAAGGDALNRHVAYVALRTVRLKV